MSSVFTRAVGPIPIAVSAQGSWIIDAEGRHYLDAAGGAVVNGIGHGRVEVAEAIRRQLETVDYVHAHAFGTAILEEYAREVAAVAPVDGARVFPVSGGSEASETAIKIARAFHVAGGEPERTVVLSRRGSYHGNTLGALDLSGRDLLREPYEPWLGRFEQVPAVNEYRCPNPSHPGSCGAWHAGRLEERIRDLGPGRIAAFVAESIGGATIGGAVPPEGYWDSVADVCRRYGVLLIVDEVMAGFGRTGRWFGIDHWGVRPDLVICAKGAASGYWPLGLVVASGRVWDTLAGSLRHGFTFSHHPGGAAAGLAVIRILHGEGLVERSARVGAALAVALREALADDPHVGEIRGRGLLIGIELVLNRDTKDPFPRSAQVTERVVSAARDRGLTCYPLAGCADGKVGDGVLLGPPLIISEPECEMVVERLVGAIAAAGRTV